MSALDWRWRHGTVSGPLHAAVGLTAAYEVTATPAVHVGPGIVLGSGAIATGIVALRAAHDGSSRTGFVYRLAAMSGGTVWLAEAVTTGWTVGLGCTLAAGALVAGALHRPVRGRDRAAVERREARAVAAAVAEADEMEQDRLHSVADQWITRIERVCRVKGVKIRRIEDWQFPGPHGQLHKTGYTLELVLPTSGETWQTIAQFQDNLAAAADLPEGCGVEVGPGASRRRALVEVSTYDALRDDILLPVPAVPRSIDHDVPLGVVRNGAPSGVPLRFNCMVLAGATGSGKSNELQTLMAGLLACNNTLVCVIDYNGGGIALPWLAAWAQEEIDRPPILWVADNDAEAMMLCTWLVGVIEHRKRAYHAANTARDDDKLAATPATPQIVLVTDEAGALDRPVLKLLAQISDRGRAAAVRTITCSLRALAEYIPTEVLAQANVRVGMRVNDRKELGYLFEWGGQMSPEDAPHTGYGHVRVGQEPPKVFKGYRTTPALIRQAAVAQAAWRPELDEVTASMPGSETLFVDRWKRSAHLISAAAGRPAGAGGAAGADDPGPTAAATGDGGFPAPPPAPPRPASWGESGLGGALDSLNAAADRLRNTQPGPRNEAADRAEFERIMSKEFEVAVPELLVRALVAFGSADRMHSKVLADSLGVRVELLGQLLSQLEVRPLKSDFQVDGKRGRGYARADVEEAAERIRAGELVPPEEVARWRPNSRPGDAGGRADLPPEWS